MMMTIDHKLFWGGLTASFLIHVGAIGFLSRAASMVKIVVKTSPPVEVMYAVAVKDQKRQKNVLPKAVAVLRSEQSSASLPQVKTLLRHDEVFPSSESSLREIGQSTREMTFGREKTLPIKALMGERKITVPMLQSEKITNPQYLSYTQHIRQKIKQWASYYADYPNFQSGDVYLTFVLSSAGVLQDVQVIANKTHASTYLQEVGVRSIRGSAPFPSFPEDFRYPELTFNVIISFELIK